MLDLTNTKIQSKIEQLLSRSYLYQALALFFRHPSNMPENLSIRKEGRIWEEALKTIDFPDKTQLSKILESLLEEFNALNFDQWIQQYEACFGHTAHGLVPSYELEYGEEHTHRQPQQLGDIAAFYNAFGLKVNQGVHERVDHIAVECEFMQYLIYKEAYALQHDGEDKVQICKEASHRFLLEHLGQWAPALALRLAKHAGDGLMKQIADFTFAFVSQDCQQCGIPPGPHDLPLRVVEEKMDTGCVNCSLKPDFQSHK